MDVLNAMQDGVKRVIMIVALLAAALGPVLIVIGKTISAIGTIMTWAPKLAGAISAVKGAFAALKDVLGDQKGQQGDLVIPVYLGNQLLDEVIVTAQQRMSLRSGGR